MKNGLLDYNFVEATEFEGVMPAAAAKLGTIGASDVVVRECGIDAHGSDALEVVDTENVF